MLLLDEEEEEEEEEVEEEEDRINSTLFTGIALCTPCLSFAI